MDKFKSQSSADLGGKHSPVNQDIKKTEEQCFAVASRLFCDPEFSNVTVHMPTVETISRILFNLTKGSGITDDNISKELSVMSQAFEKDMDFAWSWHCNIAMAMIDEGCHRDIANIGAANFMKRCFGVDTSECEHYSSALVSSTSETGACSTFGSRVAKWFDDRKITQNGSIKGQLKKLTEERTELDTALSMLFRVEQDAESKPCRVDVKDAIGDMAVVLAGLAHMNDMTFEECCEYAWNEIKDRTGHLNEDGVFVKD